MAWFNGFNEPFPMVLRYGDNGLNGLRTCKCIPNRQLLRKNVH
jgi:hypothetical protein